MTEQQTPASVVEVSGDSTALLHKAIVALRGHVASVQEGKAASKRGERTETNPILDCVNALPEIVRWLDASEFEIESAFEQYEAEIERLSAERERLREALMAAQSFIADGGMAEQEPGASIYRQVTAALTQGESRQTGLSGWQDIATAPKDRTPVLAAIHDDLYPRVCPGRPDLERWNGQRVVVHHPGLCEDGFDIGWSVSAPVGVGVGTDEWFSGWQPLPAAPTPADGGGE